MQNRTILYFVFFLFGSCNSTNNLKEITNSDIIGCWKLKDNGVSYTFLNFSKDSTAIFGSKADTVYRFKYWVKDNFLMLEDNSKTFKCPITHFTTNTFSFMDLIVNQKELKYFRDSCNSSLVPK